MNRVMALSWAQRAQAWSHVPVDDVGYLDAAELLRLPDDELMALVERMRATRYRGPLNAGGRLRVGLGLDELSGCDVLDYGCGIGLEATELARANRVWAADLHTANVALATRVGRLSGVEFRGGYLIGEGYPYVSTDQRFDVIHSCGVLHHIERPIPVLRRFGELLRPGGQVRLLLYGPGMWREAVRSEPPQDVRSAPEFATYVRHCDLVGDFADWYDPDRLAERTAGLFTVETCEYLPPGMRFLVATLRRAS